MSDELSPEAVAKISRNIHLVFDFLDAVVDQPEVLERLPDEGQAAVRSVDLFGHTYLLAAFKPPEEAAWTAHVVRSTPTDGAPASQRPVTDDRRDAHDQTAIVTTATATRATADDAFDALEHDLRARAEEAVGVPTPTAKRSPM